MNAQTERAIADLQRILPTLKQNYHPAINRAITALLRSAEVEQEKDERIRILTTERGEVTA